MKSATNQKLYSIGHHCAFFFFVDRIYFNNFTKEVACQSNEIRGKHFILGICRLTFNVILLISISAASNLNVCSQAFRRLYEEVGLGWVYAITKYEPVSLLRSETIPSLIDGLKF